LIKTFLKHHKIHNFQLKNNDFAVLSVHLTPPSDAYTGTLSHKHTKY